MSRRFDRKRQYSPDDQLPYITGTNDTPIELVGVDVKVHVTGLFAETTQVLRLHNPNARDLEGELCFPLPDSAVVCGYGIDVDGEVVDGVVVPKQEARRILEAEIRRGVDPGLVEHVQGNIYRTRIYPLPAGGNRTVKLVYLSPLTVEGSDAAYHLPLGHAKDVDKVSLRVEVSQTPVAPVAVGGLGNLSLTSFESRWVAEAKLTSAAAAEDLLIKLPNLPDHFAAVERFDGADYFCVSSRTVNAAREAWTPKRVGLLWDASGSRQNITKELELIGQLAKTWGETTFDVTVLRNVTDAEARSFAVSGGDAAELIEYIDALPRDGGTNLSNVDLTTLPHPDDEAWLLFSDGLGTIGSGLPIGTSSRVFTITGQAQSDSGLLRLLADRTGGAFVNLTTTDAANGASRIAQSSRALRLERTAGCEDVHVYSSSGRMTVVGRLTQDIGSVYLDGPGAPDDQLSVLRSQATDGPNIARAWAGQQAQVEKLLGVPNDRLAELGRRFGLVTPGTSLLVLETLEQHLEYDIEPAASRGKLRSDFLDYRRRGVESKEETQRRQVEHVLELWRDRVDWWEREFSYEPPKAKKKVAAAANGMSPPGAPSPSRSRSAAAPQMSAIAADEMGDVDFMEMEMEMEMDAPSGAMASSQSYGGGGSSKEQADDEGAVASVSIQPWSPDTPYLVAMRKVKPADAYNVYLEQRDGYAASPAFFLDCADHLLKNEQRSLGLRVLSNLLEQALDDPALLRMYAWRMQQSDELDAAVQVFERVLEMRDDEPQSHRDLALALDLRWQRDGVEEDAVRAMKLLYAVVTQSWDRFPEIELIALMELNRLIYFAKARGIDAPKEIDRRFVKRLDLDVRISMSWDADLTDVDLHVFEPTGQHAYYGHNLTEIGGLVSRDFREGYGPEEYVLRRACPGDYTVKTHYYGSHQQTLAGACTVIVTVFTNFARPNEARQVLTLRLESASDQVLVGTVTIDPDKVTAVSDDAPSWLPQFRKLEVGMSIDQITALVGQPDEMRGTDAIVLIYRPDEETELHLTTGPRLQTVEQIMHGAKLDVLKMQFPESKPGSVVDRLRRWWAGDE